MTSAALDDGTRVAWELYVDENLLVTWYPDPLILYTKKDTQKSLCPKIKELHKTEAWISATTVIQGAINFNHPQNDNRVSLDIIQKKSFFANHQQKTTLYKFTI